MHDFHYVLKINGKSLFTSKDEFVQAYVKHYGSKEGIEKYLKILDK